MSTDRVAKLSVLKSNARAMLVLQLANYLLPLLLIPYLTHRLGLHAYGIVAFGMGVFQLAVVLTDFGFGLSATYHVSKRSARVTSVNRIFGAVTICKATLALVAAFLVVGYVSIADQPAQAKAFLLLMLFPIFGQALQPTWLFQGLERMNAMTGYSVLAKLIYIVLVFAMVATRDDIYLIAIAFGIANTLATVIAIVLLLRLGYKFTWPRWRFIRAVFVSATGFFLSRAAVAAYTSAGTVFLGVFGSAVQVSLYSAAEQLYKAAQTTVGMLSQALYPYMAREKDFALLAQILKFVIVGSILGAILLFSVNKKLVPLLFGSAFLPSVPVLNVFLLVFTVAAPSVLLGYPLLGAANRLKLANTSVIAAGLVQATLLGIAGAFHLVSAIQVAICVLCSEAVVLLLRVRWANNYVWRFKAVGL